MARKPNALLLIEAQILTLSKKWMEIEAGFDKAKSTGETKQLWKDMVKVKPLLLEAIRKRNEFLEGGNTIDESTLAARQPCDPGPECKEVQSTRKLRGRKKA